MFIVIRRFLEMLLSCAVFSAIIGVLAYFGVIDGSMHGAAGTLVLIAFAVFMVFNILWLRSDYELIKNPKIYFLFNLAACLLFALVNAVFYYAASGMVYGFTFGITKVFSRVVLPNGFEFGNIWSAMALHVSLVLAVLVVPIGMGWVFDEAEKTLSDEIEADKIMSESKVSQEDFVYALINSKNN